MGYDCVRLAPYARRQAELKRMIQCSNIVAENFVPSRSRQRMDEEYVACSMNGSVVGIVGIGEKIKQDYCVKVMHESEGPLYYNASATVLNALSPTRSEIAREWREKCASLGKR